MLILAREVNTPVCSKLRFFGAPLDALEELVKPSASLEIVVPGLQLLHVLLAHFEFRRRELRRRGWRSGVAFLHVLLQPRSDRLQLLLTEAVNVALRPLLANQRPHRNQLKAYQVWSAWDWILAERGHAIRKVFAVQLDCKQRVL